MATESLHEVLDTRLQALVQEQLTRVLASAAFRRSEQQRSLLTYLVGQAIEGHGDELKEYSVGVDALGKRQDYDPRKDATVRIQMGKLRTKLEEYFRGEGAPDPIVFALPKGGFRIHFQERTEGAADPFVSPAPDPPAHHLRSAVIALSAALALALAAIGLLLHDRWKTRDSANLAARLWTPAMETLWRPFVDDGRPLTLTIGTPLFVNMDSLPVRDSGLNEWPVNELPPRLELMRQSIHATDVKANYNYNGFGETIGALRLYRLFVSRGKDITFRRANTLAWDDFRERDLILLGSPKSINHLRDFRDLHSRLIFNIEEKQIVNRSPQPGEQPVYRKPETSTDGSYSGWALITHLPGVNGSGHIMILGSPDTEGTRAACEYVTDPSTAAELVQRFPRGAHALPPAYQVLLKINSRTGVPLVITPVAFRELNAADR